MRVVAFREWFKNKGYFIFWFSDNFCKTILIVSVPVRTEKEALAKLNYW